MKKSIRKLMGVTALVAAGAAMAQAGPDFPLSELPDRLPGLDTGALQPRDTLQMRVGTRQPKDVSGQSGTGTQTYDGGMSWRGAGRWSYGWATAVFDDPTEQLIYGSRENLSFSGAEIEARYALAEGPAFYAAVTGAVGAYRFTQDNGPSDTLMAASLTLPVTYRMQGGLDVSGVAGYSWFPNKIDGREGLGPRGILGVGLGYAANERLYLYGSAKSLLKSNDNGPEGADTLLAAGVRYALTPQIATTLYISNAQGHTPLMDDLRFLASNDDAVIGLQLDVLPSGRDYSIPRYRDGLAAADDRVRFGDGITMPGAATVGSNTFRTVLSYTSEGERSLAIIASPDPDFQLEFTFDDFALADDTAFRGEAVEDTRYMVAARWQAMSEAEGDAFSFGLSAGLSRDIKKPTLGLAYLAAAGEKQLGARANLRGTLRSASYGSTDLSAIGLGLDFDLGNGFTAMAEATSVSEGDGVWAVGLRRQLANDAPAAWEIYGTNAAGRHGIGGMLAEDPQLGIALHWQTGSRLF